MWVSTVYCTIWLSFKRKKSAVLSVPCKAKITIFKFSRKIKFLSRPEQPNNPFCNTFIVWRVQQQQHKVFLRQWMNLLDSTYFSLKWRLFGELLHQKKKI